MKPHATFALGHKESGSQAYIECAMEDGKVKVVSVGFATGNVISLADVRDALTCAEHLIRAWR
jgi:hypothetical protein